MAARVSYDVIVIGAGHNGLVCAAYLARAGQRVLVLEARDRVGGMAGTSELLGNVRVPTLAHTVGRLRPSVASELKLREHGLALVEPEVRVFSPQPGGRALTLWRDNARTTSELSGDDLVTPADVAAYADVDARLRSLGRGLSELLSRVPPDLASPSLADASAGLRSSLAARARARPSERGLLRAMPMSVHDLVCEWFESDALRAAVAARGVLHTGLGPRMPGTAGVLVTDVAGNDGGLAGQTVFARGGPGALSDALASAARSHGADIRTGARAAKVLRDGQRVRGVVLASGEEIDAPVVVSSLDPKTTLLGLIDPEALGPRLGWRASNIRQAGATAKVNLALRELPRFTAAAGDERRLRGRILIAPSMAALERATRAFKYGRIPDEPLLEATVPSLVDGELVGTRRGKKVSHVMSIIVQSVPRDLRDSSWDERRGELGDTVIRVMEAYAPGLTDLIEAREVITPLDIEREYGAAGGHAMHAEVSLDQWFEWRPLHGHGRYRMPLDGLYLCGSGAHPGGGVTGGPGRLCAAEVLSDRKRGRLQ